MFQVVEDGRTRQQGWISVLAEFGDLEDAKAYVRRHWEERHRRGGRTWFVREQDEAPVWVMDERGREHEPPPPGLMRLWRKPQPDGPPT